MTSPFGPILTALTHIEEHQGEKLTVQNLADVSGYSLFHFTRLFNQLMGLPPYDYLIRRRLSVAAETLLACERRIIDIAQDSQFSSHEGFTRAFNRLFGMPPTEWRDQGRLNQHYLMPPLGEEYLFVLNEVIDRKPIVLMMDRLSLLGWTLPVSSDEDLAGRWDTLKKVIPDDQPAGRWIIRMVSAESEIPDLQFVGVRMGEKPSLNQLLVSYTLEGGEFLKLSLNQKGELSQIPMVLVFLYHCILPKIKYRVVSPVVIIHCGERMDVMVQVERMR